MANLRTLLPSPGALIAFEAAGRLGSFTRAGQELGMSQAAISHAVRGLERDLGTQLFRREHRRVSLTDAGARFFVDVTQALGMIRKSAEALRAAHEGGHVTIAVSTAMASFWMMPRLQQFREALPGIDLRLQTSERDLDLMAENIPLGIRGGDPSDWPGYEAMPLAEEVILAVAGAAYAGPLPLPETPADIARHRLIHLDEPYRPAVDWGDWFESAGLARAMVPRGLVINDYALVMQAVMEGQGIALGWWHLIERLLRTGLLIQLSAHRMHTRRRFHLVWPRERPPGRRASAVRDWLLAQGEFGGAP